MEAMANSSGELRESYSTYMESAAAHINQLKASFEGLAKSMFDSDSIKSVADMLSGMLSFIDNIVKLIGGVPTLITGIAAALSLVKNVGVLNVFKSGVNFIKSFSTGAYAMSDDFVTQLDSDVAALKSFQTAVAKGTDRTIAIDSAMAGASDTAKNYARNTEISSDTIKTFTVEQRQSQLALAATGSSFKNQVSIIKAYNKNLDTMGLSQDEFCAAVKQSNPELGKYLSKVDAGSASTFGYILSLVKAKAATLALRIGTMALNAALSGLIAMGISAIFTAISNSINAAKKRMDEAVSSINDLAESVKALDDYKEKVTQLREELENGGLALSDVTDKRKELLDIQKQLIDKYGSEASGINLVTGALEKQIGVVDALTTKKTEEWLRDNRTAVDEANDYLHGHVNGIFDLATSRMIESWIDKYGDGTISYEYATSRSGQIANYDKMYAFIRNYIDTNSGASQQDIDVANSVLDAIIDAKNFINNETYQNSEKIYKQAVENVVKTKGVYRTYYNDLLQLNQAYDDAVAKNDEASAEQAYQALVNKYDTIIKNGNFKNTDNVRGEDIKAYFENQFQDFMNLSVPVRLKVDIEGTKREFDSTKSELIKMYTAVGDNGFSIAYDKGVPYLLDENNISVNQAEEFNAICDAAKKAGVSLESYIEALVQYGKVVDDTVDKNATASLTTMFNGYTEEVKQAQDAISPLLDAYNKLQKGELSNSDIVTLISDKFPSLIQYTDNLSVGIQKLAKDKLAELKEKLDAVDRSKLSEDDLKAYDKFIEYIDSLNDGFSSTIAYYEKIQSKTKSVSDSITTLISLSKEITESESLSMSSVDKIMSDDTLTSLRPYLNDVKAMLPIVNKLIADQKQAYEDLYNEQQRLADPDAYLKAVQEKEDADEDALQDSIKRIDEQVKKFKEKYDVDLSNWDKLGDDKKKLLQNTNAELISKQITLINKYNELYGIDLRNFKNVAAAKEAIIEKISADFVRSNTFQQISQYLNEHNLLSMHNGILSFGGNAQDWEPVQVMLDRAKLSLSDLRLYLQNGIMPEDKSKSLQEYFKENLEKEFKDVDLAQLNADLNSFINPFTIKDDTWEKLTESIGAGSSSSSKAKTWFEQQYAYHNHLVNMDQEKQQDYLNWLDSAYKQAYNQGIIDLDAYYKYEEEVYNGRKKLAGDTSNWFEKQYKEHQHLLKMEKEDEATYLKWLDSAYKKAYAEGLITLDEYRKYQEEVYDGIKKLKDNAESAIKELINIRINMLKEDINKEKEAINTRLKNLKEFYDKQKEMLQDKYDQEKYLEEQSEKRKSVSDIQEKIEQLRFDDSASAQKKRIELQKDLLDAQKELTDFEKEHSYNQTKDQLDKLYEQQEKNANKQIEALEKRANNPKELYEQALNDIRNGSQALYGQMIEWNNVYGDGIRNTITKAWEEAYKAEKQYFEYTGVHYNGVNLVNATGYIKGVSGYASGTNNATAGIHRVDENGIETIFQSADGQRYRMFSSGEKVLNASASDFLYKFANKGRDILNKLFNGTSHSYNNVNPGVIANNIQQGDIIIQGNADRTTISEIRRAQRENLEQMLKQLNRLK